MCLVRLQFLVVAVLDVDRPATQLRHAGAEVVHHGRGRRLVAHLEERLVLALEHQHVGDAAERQPQVDDLRLRDVARDVADVDHPRRFAHVAVQLHLQRKNCPNKNLIRQMEDPEETLHL